MSETYYAEIIRTPVTDETSKIQMQMFDKSNRDNESCFYDHFKIINNEKLL